MHIWGELRGGAGSRGGGDCLPAFGCIAFGHPTTIVARFMIYFLHGRHGCAVVGRWFKWIRSDTAKLKD